MQVPTTAGEGDLQLSGNKIQAGRNVDSHSDGPTSYLPGAGWMAAEADPEARTILHCAKVFAAEASEKVASLAMQIMAGKRVRKWKHGRAMLSRSEVRRDCRHHM